MDNIAGGNKGKCYVMVTLFPTAQRQGKSTTGWVMNDNDFQYKQTNAKLFKVKFTLDETQIGTNLKSPLIS